MRKAKECLSTNLKKVHEDIQQLEITYRTLDAFFANVGHGEVNCLTLMNVNKEKLKIHDSDDTLAVIDELEKYVAEVETEWSKMHSDLIKIVVKARELMPKMEEDK